MAADTPSVGSPFVSCVYRVQQRLHLPAGFASVDFYASFSLRANTRKLYTAHQNTFLSICRQLGINADSQLSELDLCAAVGSYARTHKRTTVEGFVSAVAYRATSLGHGALPRGALFKQTMRGIQNFHADQTSTPKTAITTVDLIAMYRLIEHTTFEGARDWCACALAFFGLLRINEYTNGGLQHGDVGFTTAGIMITIRVSKTSLQPTRIDMAARADFLCPALALAHYLAFFAQYPDLPQRPTDSLFITRRTATEYQNTTDTEFISTFVASCVASLPHAILPNTPDTPSVVAALRQ